MQSADFQNHWPSLSSMASDLWAVAAIGLGMAGLSPVASRVPDVAGRATVADVQQGSGPAAAPGDRVTVHFIVKTEDGREVANTYKRGLPYTLRMGQAGVGEFWSVALLGAREGSERQVSFASSDLFGPQGVPPVVGGDANLVATVRVIRVLRQPGVAAAKHPQR